MLSWGHIAYCNTKVMPACEKIGPSGQCLSLVSVEWNDQGHFYFPSNGKQYPQSWHRPEPIDLKSSALTMRPSSMWKSEVRKIFKKILHQPFSLTWDENMVQILALGECGALSPLEQHCKHTGDNQGWQQSR